MNMETFPKLGKALKSVFTNYFSLSRVVIFLNGCKIRKTLSDLKVVKIVIMSIKLFNNMNIIKNLPQRNND